MGFFSIITPHPVEESGLLQQEGCNTATNYGLQYVMLSFPGQEFYLFLPVPPWKQKKEATSLSPKNPAGEHLLFPHPLTPAIHRSGKASPKENTLTHNMGKGVSSPQDT